MHVIVGSSAMSEWGIDFREPSDLDVWELDKGEKFEGHDSHVVPRDILEYLLKDSKNKAVHPYHLYTIKCSHANWPLRSTNKTLEDIIFFQKKMGYYKVDTWLFNRLYEFWKEVHGKKQVSLDKSKKDFFYDNVNYIYDHDYLHELVAYNKEPVYKSCLSGEVKIDFDKFMSLSHEEKIQMIKEEIYVITLERFLIPDNFLTPPYLQYKKALNKYLTSLIKDRFFKFSIENLKDYYYLTDFTFYRKFTQRDKSKDRYYGD